MGLIKNILNSTTNSEETNETQEQQETSSTYNIDYTDLVTADTGNTAHYADSIRSQSGTVSILDEESGQSLSSIVEKIEDFSSAYSDLKSITDKILTNTNLANINTVCRNIDKLNATISNQNILINYILKHVDPSELDQLKKVQQDINAISPVIQYTTIKKIEEVPLNTEDITISPDQINQTDNGRFVSVSQIDKWDEMASSFSTLLDKVNYTKNPKIININDIPFATKEMGGLMSSKDKETLDNISQTLKASIVDWNSDDSLDPSFIKNKPTNLPAAGGDAEFVGGYNIDAIKNDTYITIGLKNDSKYHCDYYVTEDYTLLNALYDAVEKSNKPIYIYPGVYYVDIGDNYELMGLEIHFGSAKVILKSTNIVFVDCDVYGLTLLESDTKDPSYIILNGNNKFHDCNISKSVYVSGSNNIITSNIFCCDGDSFLKIGASNMNDISTDNIISKNIFNNNFTVLVTKDDYAKNVSNNIVSENIIKGNTIINSGDDNIFSSNICPTIECNGGTANYFNSNKSKYVFNSISFTHNLIYQDNADVTIKSNKQE